MRSERIDLWEKSEYHYEMAFGFIPNLVSYLHEDGEERPCILVVPGGGYVMVSPTEAEIVALEFYKRGYNAFVCTYTTNLFGVAPLKMQPMKDLSRAIRMIRKNAVQYQIDPSRIILCGFSAGAHLCGSVCVHFEDVQDEKSELCKISNRPDAAILSYPVITSGEKAHRGSFDALLGFDATSQELGYMSLENHVTKDTPPCFMWHTATDEAVPVENSCMFAMACKEYGVNYEHHIFAKGHHGLSLANDKWANGEFGPLYTLEQTNLVIQAAREGKVPGLQESREIQPVFQQTEEERRSRQLSRTKYMEVGIWTELADRWLKSIECL